MAGEPGEFGQIVSSFAAAVGGGTFQHLASRADLLFTVLSYCTTSESVTDFDSKLKIHSPDSTSEKSKGCRMLVLKKFGSKASRKSVSTFCRISFRRESVSGSGGRSKDSCRTLHPFGSSFLDFSRTPLPQNKQTSKKNKQQL